MGLAICAQVIAAHHAQIGCLPLPQSTTFQVTLPL